MNYKKCESCTYEFKPNHKLQKYCSDECTLLGKKSLDAERQFKERIKNHNVGGLYSAGLIDCEYVSISKILHYQFWFCAFCRQKFNDVSEITIDHVVPISKGGGHTYSNIQLLHKDCNSTKSAMEPEELKKKLYWKLHLLDQRRKAKNQKKLSEEEMMELMERALCDL